MFGVAATVLLRALHGPSRHYVCSSHSICACSGDVANLRNEGLESTVSKRLLLEHGIVLDRHVVLGTIDSCNCPLLKRQGLTIQVSVRVCVHEFSFLLPAVLLALACSLEEALESSALPLAACHFQQQRFTGIQNTLRLNKESVAPAVLAHRSEMRSLCTSGCGSPLDAPSSPDELWACTGRFEQPKPDITGRDMYRLG